MSKATTFTTRFFEGAKASRAARRERLSWRRLLAFGGCAAFWAIVLLAHHSKGAGSDHRPDTATLIAVAPIAR